MAVIYMVHPVHGAKIATLEAEAIHDEANGWQRMEPPSGEVSTFETEAVYANSMETKRRGRPPRAPA